VRTIVIADDQAAVLQMLVDAEVLVLEAGPEEISGLLEQHPDANLVILPKRAAAPPADLSGRELEVLRLIAFGYTNGQIAERLVLSPRTVESHRARIQRKLQRTARADLVRYALDHGLLY
jgi:DNA-binding NarL/FixJ family response regulator